MHEHERMQESIRHNDDKYNCNYSCLLATAVSAWQNILIRLISYLNRWPKGKLHLTYRTTNVKVVCRFKLWCHMQVERSFSPTPPELPVQLSPMLLGILWCGDKDEHRTDVVLLYLSLGICVFASPPHYKQNIIANIVLSSFITEQNYGISLKMSPTVRKLLSSLNRS